MQQSVFLRVAPVGQIIFDLQAEVAGLVLAVMVATGASFDALVQGFCEAE